MTVSHLDAAVVRVLRKELIFLQDWRRAASRKTKDQIPDSVRRQKIETRLRIARALHAGCCVAHGDGDGGRAAHQRPAQPEPAAGREARRGRLEAAAERSHHGQAGAAPARAEAAAAAGGRAQRGGVPRAGLRRRLAHRPAAGPAAAAAPAAVAAACAGVLAPAPRRTGHLRAVGYQDHGLLLAT